jgi:uncharacterized protein (DUF342 family)
MVSLDSIRSTIQSQLKDDRELRYVNVYSDTLEGALSDAAIQFDTTIANLEYEVLAQGSPGIMKIGKRPWLIRVHKLEREVVKTEGVSAVAGEEGDEVVVERSVDADGAFFVRFFGSDIMLKVIPPVGNGVPVEMQDIQEAIANVDVVSLDTQTVKDCLNQGTDSQYAVIGIYNHASDADALFSVSVSSDEMEVLITAKRPGKNGADISPDRVRAACRMQGIVDDVDMTMLNKFIDNPVFDDAVVIARGIPPINGANAEIQYFFEIDTSKLIIKETEGGRIDYKNLNIIQNVVEGQTVAQKNPAVKGKQGKTLLGKELPAKDGEDIPLPAGINVRAEELLLISEINGRVFFQNNKVNVEPILELDSVSIKSGNITFLGTVIVKGNVADGYSVKASGDVKINGTVGSSNLEADGDITIQGGIVGHNEETIRAGKSIWVKFIQNSTVEAGEFIVVSDGIIGSNVTANKKILLNGKRAVILGGYLRATEEINAKTIGAADSGTETILETGYDVRKKMRLDELFEKQAANIKELNEIELNLKTVESLKNTQKTLPANKQILYDELTQKQNYVTGELRKIAAECKDITASLSATQIEGRVSASAVVYPGVKIAIRDAKTEVKTEVRAVTFYYRNGVINRGKYEELSLEDSKRMADGNTTN